MVPTAVGITMLYNNKETKMACDSIPVLEVILNRSRQLRQFLQYLHSQFSFQKKSLTLLLSQ